MNPHPPHELEIPLEDEENDHLIEKAAALMHRHESFVAHDDDDLPILTDVVETDPLESRIEPFIGDTPPIILEAAEAELSAEPDLDSDQAPEVDAPAPIPAAPDLSEKLAELDELIARQISDWIDNELPQLVSRELDAFSERIREQAATHLRAALLPQLSTGIAEILDRKEPT